MFYETKLLSKARMKMKTNIGVAKHPALKDPDAKFPGGFFVMYSEKSLADCETLAQARTEGKRLCDENILPSSFWISDYEGNHVEDIHRSDGRGLSEMIKDFNAASSNANMG